MTEPDLKTKLTKSIDHLKQELSQVRTGRANPSLLENIVVEAYGSKMTIKELGIVNVQDAQMLTVTPWDKSLGSAIVKAINESDLKLNAAVDGTLVRVPIPTLTAERRGDLVKLVGVKVEECKTSMRNIRQDAMKDIDKEFSDKLIGEDDKFAKREKVETTIKDFVKQADIVGESKKSDLAL